MLLSLHERERVMIWTVAKIEQDRAGDGDRPCADVEDVAGVTEVQGRR